MNTLNYIEHYAQYSNPEKEKNDDEVREDIETVTPDTENLQPGPDKEDEEQKTQ